jgi:serine/threonine-protein kinase
MLIADRYETQELLGTGGMGEVYLARDSQSGQEVAVKLLKEEVTEDLVVRFDRECAVLARMSHPAVVRVLDRGESDGRVFYAMDYIPWPTLSQRISSRFREGKGFTLEELA